MKNSLWHFVLSCALSSKHFIDCIAARLHGSVYLVYWLLSALMSGFIAAATRMVTEEDLVLLDDAETAEG